MVKIALLGNVNMDLFVPKLKELLSDEGIDNEFYVSGYNQYVQDLINPASTFNQDKFDIAIVFIDGEEYFNF
jgi:predicted enzyme involved in methoxymalonyl-ACP biosynthesis